MRTPLKRLFTAAATLVAIAALTTPAMAQVTAQDLGTLPGGSYSGAYDVNDSAQAVGYSGTATGATHATLWTSSGVTWTATDLGTLCGGSCSYYGDWSYAYGINSSGQVVGISSSNSGSNRAFIWQSGTMTELAPLPGDYYSSAFGISDDGRAVGYSSGGGGGARAVLWDAAGVPQNLGALCGGSCPYGDSSAYDINDAGQVVGYSVTSSGGYHAFIWDSTNGMTDLGVALGACSDYSYGFGINASGDVSGLSNLADCYQAAVKWTGGVLEQLGPAGAHSLSELHAINDAGDVSGVVLDYATCGGYWRPVLFTQGTIVPLPELGEWSPGCAYGWADGMSNTGLIAGYSSTGDGSTHATLWTTEPPDTTPPAVTVNAPTGQLWPPNGKMVPVTFTGTITDEGSGLAAATFAVVDEYGQVQPSGAVTVNGSGNYSITVLLQSRRNGTDKDGRTYRLTVTATDNKGNTASASASAVVVHDQRK